MAQARVLEGTGLELQKMLARHPNDRFRLVPLPISENEDNKAPASLADIFAGRIGGLHGGGKAWSEDTGKAFAEGMKRKYGADNDQEAS